MQYLAAQYLGSLIIAMLIGALLGYLWRQFVATGGYSKSDHEDLQRKYQKSLAEIEQRDVLVKKGETRNKFLTADLSTKDKIIDRLQADSARDRSEIFSLRQKGHAMSSVASPDATSQTDDFLIDEPNEVSPTDPADEGFVETLDETMWESEDAQVSEGESLEPASTTDSADAEEEGVQVSMHEYMAIVTELDKTRKENLRLSKEISSPDDQGETSVASQEMKKELTLAYSTISDLRAALASTGKTVSLRKHNELRDEYVKVREALRRVQSRVSDDSVSVSQVEFQSLADKLASCQRELAQYKSELDANRKSSAKSQRDLTACQEEVFKLRSEIASAAVERKTQTVPKAATKSAPKKKASGPDDLTKIKGIGPVIQRQLKKMGITTFEQIAAFKAADIRRVGEELGTFPDRIKRDKWVQSARKLHKEKYGD